MTAYADYIQTFYVNPDAVAGATSVSITSVDLFFKGKPSTVANISGLSEPGISVWICEVVNSYPVPTSVAKSSVVSVPYARINTSLNASIATTVSFNNPVSLPTGRSYGIAIKFDDPAFEIWYNKQGDALVASTGKTTTASSGSQNRLSGQLYTGTSTADIKPLVDRTLKFNLKIAKFSAAASGNITLVNRDYEFFTVASTAGTFIGGEDVYQDVANATGTVTISTTSKAVVGSGTDFTSYAVAVGDSILLTDGSVANTFLGRVSSVANGTYLTLETLPSFSGSGVGWRLPVVGKVYYNDPTRGKLYLVDSNAANNTFKFATGYRLKGIRSGASANVVSIDNYGIDTFNPKFLVGNPATSNYNVTYQMATSGNTLYTSALSMNLGAMNDTPYQAYVLSRSIEVDTAASGSLYGTLRKSVVANLSVSSSVTGSNYAVPFVNSTELDMFVYQNDINSNTATSRFGMTDYDTEVQKNGLARSKYISKKITFDSDKKAEDLVVYLTGYRPAGTEIRVYAKVHNSSDPETFDDKVWTPLEIKNNVEKFSASEADLVEYTYGFQQHPPSRFTLSGVFTVQSGNSVVLATVDPSANAATGDLIKIYNPLIPNNHEVFTVLSSNTTSITVNRPITNNNIVGSMSVDRLKYRQSAWNNISNDNVARYLSSSQVVYDTFNSMQIKAVLLSNTTYIVPHIEQIEAIGVST